MWRFLLVSFAVLGWSFYELSGGSDYEPSENSIQARAKLIRPQARPRPEETPREERTLAEVEALMDRLDQTEAETEEQSAALAAARSDGLSIIEAEASRPKAELLNLSVSGMSEEDDTAIEAAITAAMDGAAPSPDRIRWVKENVVDLRSGPGLDFDRITQITKGTEVAVLENPGHGWLNVRVIESYQTGWLAEWLVTAAE